ncbi:nuclear-pore anchor-like isoform X1 [Magnolia sinica]|uniref:nuclear-pore anchor-like isoform X1 n=1 Tax=Magnolia sinica TaxID=86752 RepID=UPI002659B881|nr:nuclear-pore anchor-like isoform X1 [Magnolia sinica]
MAFSHRMQALVEDYIFSGGIFSMSVFQYANEEKSSQDISMGCVSHLSINMGKSNPNKNKTDSIPSSIDNKADKLKKSVEDEIHFLKGRVSELESDLVSKSTEVTSAVSRKEEALSSAFAEIDRLKEENSIKI